ncbi:SDR family NAD(P)-dependent oxidoreductase [Streptomyces sp. R44]|uniref:SDR family NAD(P)-dependent oxidoreductase n=1 Tax=Streptomyces sp. R44 TaxID=3238633 RepID=A0AB39TDT0_9ACTN
MTASTAEAASGDVVLITGAGRGLGLALAEEWLARPSTRTVLLGVRDPRTTTVRELRARHGDRAVPVPMDDTARLRRPGDLASLLGEPARIDVLVNCAGANQDPALPGEASKGPAPLLDPDAVRAVHDVNVLGPLTVVQACLPYLRRSPDAVVVNIGSARGSLRACRDARSYAYAMSKAALHMLTRKLACELPDMTVLVWSPGWVATDMGGVGAPATPREAARSLLALLAPEQRPASGQFVDRDGARIPW